jgi:peptide/nickel transport system substrate-binding protein
MIFSKAIRLAAILLTASGIVSTGKAQNLMIGSRAEVTMDPHHLWLASNISYYVQLYGMLTQLGPDAQAQPMLAESWRLIDDKTWEFKLNKKARFHNGQPVTADDVIASYVRARDLPNAAASFKGAFQGIVEFKAVDPGTVHLITDRPNGSVPQQMTQVAIVPAEIARTATQADFISGKAAIGAGPYRFVRYQAGDRLVLARFDDYFGDKPRWAQATFRFIADDAARVAALLGNDVELIDFVQPADVKRLKSDSRTAVHLRDSDRVMYLIPDIGRTSSPFVRGNDGQPMDRNPMQDVRVRKAISLAIDRDGLADRVMDGVASPANQTVPPGMGGYADSLPRSRFDLEEAKKLMAEAGYANGFRLTIHCPNDRYVNDARVCQAVAPMLTRLGIRMEVVTEPRSVFFPRVTNQSGERASLMLLAWGSAWTGDASGALAQTLHTLDKAKGLGTWNLGGYSNPKVDALIEQSSVLTDRAQRSRVQAEAMAMAMQDVALVPLMTLKATYASRRNMAYTPYADEETIANAVSIVP